jgi:hypothetical protein
MANPGTMSNTSAVDVSIQAVAPVSTSVSWARRFDAGNRIKIEPAIMTFGDNFI